MVGTTKGDDGPAKLPRHLHWQAENNWGAPVAHMESASEAVATMEFYNQVFLFKILD